MWSKAHGMMISGMCENLFIASINSSTNRYSRPWCGSIGEAWKRENRLPVSLSQVEVNSS